jgi:hypothetical protein
MWAVSLVPQNEPKALFEQTLTAVLPIMHADMANMQMTDENENAQRLLASRGFEANYDEDSQDSTCIWSSPSSWMP